MAQNCLCPSLISGLNFCNSAFCTLQIGGGSRPVCRANCDQMCTYESLNLDQSLNSLNKATGRASQSQLLFSGFEGVTQTFQFSSVATFRVRMSSTRTTNSSLSLKMPSPPLSLSSSSLSPAMAASSCFCARCSEVIFGGRGSSGEAGDSGDGDGKGDSF